MNQYDDGTFGAIFPEKDMLELLSQGIPENLVCTHWGTESELAKIKDRATHDKNELDELKDRIDSLEAKVNGEVVTNGVITKIAPDIVKQFLK